MKGSLFYFYLDDNHQLSSHKQKESHLKKITLNLKNICYFQNGIPILRS